MRRQRRLSPWVYILLALFSFFLLPLRPSASFTASRDDQLVDALVANLTHPSQHIRIEAIKGVEALKDPTAVPALIELLRFNELFGISPVPALEQLTNQKLEDNWHQWVEWLQQHEEIRPNQNFLAWKANLYTRLDPAFENFLYPGVPYRIRLEEIVSGGDRLRWGA